MLLFTFPPARNPGAAPCDPSPGERLFEGDDEGDDAITMQEKVAKNNRDFTIRDIKGTTGTCLKTSDGITVVGRVDDFVAAQSLHPEEIFRSSDGSWAFEIACDTEEV